MTCGLRAAGRRLWIHDSNIEGMKQNESSRINPGTNYIITMKYNVLSEVKPTIGREEKKHP
jgi:hypothetical protein